MKTLSRQVIKVNSLHDDDLSMSNEKQINFVNREKEKDIETCFESLDAC